MRGSGVMPKIAVAAMAAVMLTASLWVAASAQTGDPIRVAEQKKKAAPKAAKDKDGGKKGKAAPTPPPTIPPCRLRNGPPSSST